MNNGNVWVEKSDCDGIRVSTRREEKGTIGIRIETILDLPIEACFAVLT
jgi:hypothetical protein